jgi:hypothetical protein
MKTKRKKPVLRVVKPVPEKKTEVEHRHVTEWVDIASLTPHPRNYRKHPEDQIGHLMQSLREHGYYRNVVTARDGTILAGHGVIEAATKLGLIQAPIFRMNLAPNDPRALKILASDNELPRFSDNDDRQLSTLLAEIMKQDETGLLGTGYDEKSLAALLLVTRPASEIRDHDAALELVGMPEYDPGGKSLKLIVSFETEDARKKFVKLTRLDGVTYKGTTWSARWPPALRFDVSDTRS